MTLEIKCSDLGNSDCNWKAVANTEDKLVDFVAVHARDHHGVQNFTQEMIANVKNKISTPAGKETTEEEPAMMEYSCPDCDWRYIAQTNDLIVDAVALHARDVHNVNIFTEEMRGSVKKKLKPWSGR
jgi:predicted small metal-binding protein